MNIAIVGAGITGANILKGLLTHENLTPEDHIDVYEKREYLGSGMPYHPTDDETIMLNTKPDKLSVDLENPNDFSDWLEKNYGNPYNHEQLISRPKYGRYLNERFLPYFQHEQVTTVQDEVINLKVLDKETHELAKDHEKGPFVYQLQTKTGWIETTYEAVFFAVGHSPYNDFYHLMGTKNYIHNPYPVKEKLGDLKNKQKIAVIGSGATGVDLMRFFFTHYDLEYPLTFYDIKEPFYFVDIPYEKEDYTISLSMEWIESQKDKHNGFIPLEVMVETIKEDLQNENADIKKVYNYYKANTLELNREAIETKDQKLAAVQNYASQTIALLSHLYSALSAEDRKIYYEKYYDILQFFKSKTPYLSYQWLIELADSGKIEACSDLKDIKVLEDGRFKLMTESTEEVADIIVNATGFTSNLQQVAKQFPLIRNLYNQRIILPHVNGKFVLVDWPQSRIMNQRFGQMDNLFFLGLLIGGTQHENNASEQAVEHGIYTAKNFMDTRSET